MGKRTERIRDLGVIVKDHIQEYKQFPLENAKRDVYAIGKNLKDNHGKRMAAAMALSGFTTPLKAYLETSGKSIMGSVYDFSPEVFQKGFDSIYYSIPQSMEWLIDFSTSGEELSDFNSFLARGISIGTGYVVGHTVMEQLREKPLRKMKLREKGALKEVGKGAYDFSFALSLGGIWEYVKYGSVQYLMGDVDASKTTNSTLAVLFPTAALHVARGWLLDVSGDLVGYKESERTPNWLAKKSQKFKKNVFRTLTAGAIGATALVYAFNDGQFFPTKENVEITQEVQQTEGDFKIQEKLENKLRNSGTKQVLEDVF
jgi:hypothetical protein